MGDFGKNSAKLLWESLAAGAERTVLEGDTGPWWWKHSGMRPFARNRTSRTGRVCPATIGAVAVVLLATLGMAPNGSAAVRTAVTSGAAAAASGQAPAFGTINDFGWRKEHERITVLAMACDSPFQPDQRASPCFEPKTLSNLAGGDGGNGSSGGFGAVGAADNVAAHFSGGPDFWHCDGADYLDVPGYPRSRVQASTALSDCRVFAQSMLGNGLKAGNAVYPLCRDLQRHLTWRCEGVTEVAYLMFDGKGRIDVSQPAKHTAASGCSFNGAKGRIKCLVLQQFGYALHAIQDFFSHSNYADVNPTTPYTFANPPGLGLTAPVPYWDLTKVATPSVPDDRLSTGCFPNSKCADQGRTNHDVLNKDKGKIDVETGVTSQPDTPRGRIWADSQSNFGRAVRAAVIQTRAAWTQLQSLIAAREGDSRARKIACAIASDTPNNC